MTSLLKSDLNWLLSLENKENIKILYVFDTRLNAKFGFTEYISFVYVYKCVKNYVICGLSG